MAQATDALEQFQFCFDEADTNKSGTLTCDEVIKVVEAQGGTKEEAQTIFSFMDSNNDSEVTKAEFSKAIAGLPPNVVHEFKLRKAFRTMDKDKSGSLTFKEIRDAIGNTPGFDNTAIFELLNQLREDGSQSIDYEEFLRTHTKHGSKAHLRAIFQKMDTDKSGFLTYNEIATALSDDSFLKLSVPKMMRLLQAQCEDHDKKLSYEEFVNSWEC